MDNKHEELYRIANAVFGQFNMVTWFLFLSTFLFGGIGLFAVLKWLLDNLARILF